MTHPAPIPTDDLRTARWVATHPAETYPEARLDAWIALKSARGFATAQWHITRLQRMQQQMAMGDDAMTARAARLIEQHQEALRERATPVAATTVPATLITPARLQIRHLVEQTTGILTGIGLTAAVAWVCLIGIPAAVQMLI